VALPRWLGVRWLWIIAGLDAPLRVWQGNASGRPVARDEPNLEFLAGAGGAAVVVLDYRGAGAVPAAWWPALATALAPGGVLFLCGPRAEALPGAIRAVAPELQPAAWHVLTPGQDGYWYLRPALAALRQMIDSQLQPPYSVRAWLTQVRRRWAPSSDHVACLPVWRARSEQDLPFSGALAPALLALAAGRPVRGPLGLLHTGLPGVNPDKHLLFLLETDATAPFALIKWAQNTAAQRLRDEHAALTQIHDLDDALLATSCPPSWGPFVTGAGALVTIERYLPARSMHAELRTSLRPRLVAANHFRRASAWLNRFATVMCDEPRPLDAALVAEYIAAPLHALAARFDTRLVPAGAVQATLASVEPYLGSMVGFTAEHGDLWVANLLLPPAAHGLYVIDWEHYRPLALPGFDMLLFCATYAGEVPWRPFGWVPPEAALQRAFVQPTWLQPYMARFLARACVASRLPRGLLPALLPVMLARMALRAAHGLPPEADPAENYWLRMLQAWWRRPAPTWLETWAQTPPPGPPAAEIPRSYDW